MQAIKQITQLWGEKTLIVVIAAEGRTWESVSFKKVIVLYIKLYIFLHILEVKIIKHYTLLKLGAGNLRT